MIAIHSLSSVAQRRDGEACLESVSLEIAAGEIVTLVGAAGSGRRTLQAVLALADNDWSGEYVLFGNRAHELELLERARMIGFADRDALLVDCLSVEENLEIPLAFTAVPHGEREALIADVLGRLRLAGIRRAEADALPADHRRLAAIAKALVARPRLLVVEEPLANLHPLQVRLLARELTRLRDAGCTIVQSVAREDGGLAPDRVFRVDRGRCVEVAQRMRVAAT